MTLRDTVQTFFTEDGWPVQPAAQGDGLVTTASDGELRWMCLASFPDEARFVFYSVLPFAVAEDRRDAVARLCTRANFGLPTASFELDLDDGELRARTSLDIEDGTATVAMVRAVVMSNVAVVTHYGEALLAVATLGADPDTAAEEADGDL